MYCKIFSRSMAAKGPPAGVLRDVKQALSRPQFRTAKPGGASSAPPGFCGKISFPDR